jgi:hypothetical protein
MLSPGSVALITAMPTLKYWARAPAMRFNALLPFSAVPDHSSFHRSRNPRASRAAAAVALARAGSPVTTRSIVPMSRQAIRRRTAVALQLPFR